MEKKWIVALSLAVVLALGWVFQWKETTLTVPGERVGTYERGAETRTFRTNRFSGRSEVLTPHGWISVDNADPLAQAFAGLR